MTTKRTVWTEDERELIAVRARQIRAERPDVGLVKLFELVQDVLPNSRKRCWHNRHGDRWIVQASHAPSASALASDLANRLATMRADLDALAGALGPLLGIPSETTDEQPADDSNENAPIRIGQKHYPIVDRQTGPGTPTRDKQTPLFP